MVLELPPQHIAEEAFADGAEVPDESGQGVAAPSRIAGWSRLAFRVPATTSSVPFALEPLLSLLGTWELQVVDAALPRSEDPSPPGCLSLGFLGIGPGGPALRAPAPEETAVELPFRLILSPPRQAGFVHRSTPSPAGGGRVELWHSQLGVAPASLGGPDAPERSVRAVWLRPGDGEVEWHPEAPVPTPAHADEPFRMPLDHNLRHQVVHLSANFRARRGRPSVSLYPRAIPVRRLAVTSLGATVDLRGEWTPPAGMSLEEWAQRATLGRDHYVRTVEAGWLFPFGHRASRVIIYERRFDSGAARGALVRYRSFVRIRDPLRGYGLATAPSPQSGRTMPLRWIRVRTLVTPDLQTPNARAFELRLTDGTPLQLHLQAGDKDAPEAANVVDFHCGVWFVAQDAVKADVDAAVSGFGQRAVPVASSDGGGTPGAPLDVVQLGAADDASGDSTWRVHTITWRGDAVAPPARDLVPPPPFHPRAASVGLRIPAVEMVAAAPAETTVTFHQRFVEHGLDPAQNPGAVVAELPQLPLGFAGRGDRAGGLVRPELGITGLSRQLGPVAGPKIADVASGAFNPSDFFGGAAPKLFGTLELDRLLEATALVDGTVQRAPKLVMPAPDGEAVLEWEPKLRDYPAAPKALFITQPDSRLQLRVSAQGATGPRISCTLEHFELRLIPGFECVELHFDKTAFSAAAGKPDVEVVLAQPVRFVGALSFVETLTKIIPVDAFSDPPSLDVTPSGAEAGMSLSLPSLPLGMFSLENISLGAGVLVPFDERALAVRFNFCQRHEPFLLTVSALGGGGFFLIELDARGLHRLEAALEFGASLSLDFGVASGGVHVMAGIYFAYETGKGAVLTGYVRIGGNVSVLGLVSVSVELNLSLSYETASGKAAGRATLTIEIELFLFSTSVEISCERKFAGSSSDPPFEVVMRPYVANEEGVGDPPTDLELPAGEWPWQEYCGAYA